MNNNTDLEYKILNFLGEKLSNEKLPFYERVTYLEDYINFVEDKLKILKKYRKIFAKENSNDK